MTSIYQILLSFVSNGVDIGDNGNWGDRIVEVIEVIKIDQFNWNKNKSINDKGEIISKGSGLRI